MAKFFGADREVLSRKIKHSVLNACYAADAFLWGLTGLQVSYLVQDPKTHQWITKARQVWKILGPG